MAGSDEKRLKSLLEKKAAYKQQKSAIKEALSCIDLKRNNKIIFNDDNINEQKDVLAIDENKKQLFSDDEDSVHDISNQFQLKKQYKGEKGQKLLELQSRYAYDERFVIDSRFADDVEKNVPADIDTNPTDKSEKDHQLEVLQNVLGVDKLVENSSKSKFDHKSIVRFDPSKDDHLKFEVKQDAEGGLVKKKSKKLKTVNSEEISESDKTPTVSKETFYNVTDTLKKSLQEKQEFSLLNTFGVAEEKDKEEGIEERPEIIERTKYANRFTNPFKHDSSESEDEEIEIPQRATRSESKNFVGLWKEPFFFSLDDNRLKEGIDFISNVRTDTTESQFSNVRQELKQIVRAKVRNNKRNIRSFQKKLGGKKFRGIKKSRS